jgi:ABC-type amino acid transport substrate-binding protein
MRRRFALAVFAVLLVAAAHEWVHAAPAPGGVLSRIKNTGRLTLGYRADARPFSYTDDSGLPAGYSIALCQKISDETKRDLGLSTLKVDWIPVAFEQRFRALSLGEIDLLCGADTVTLSRRAEADFSIPIFPGGIGAMLRSDSSPRLRDVLAGRGQPFHPVWRANATQLLQSRDFTVVGGTTAETWLNKRMNDLDVVAGVARVNTYNEGIQRVINRRADVFFGDRAILLDVAKRHSATRDLVVLDRLFTYEPLALALPPGDDDFRLLVDRALSRLYRSAEFPAIYTKSFPEPDEATLTFFRWNELPE